MDHVSLVLFVFAAVVAALHLRARFTFQMAGGLLVCGGYSLYFLIKLGSTGVLVAVVTAVTSLLLFEDHT